MRLLDSCVKDLLNDNIDVGGRQTTDLLTILLNTDIARRRRVPGEQQLYRIVTINNTLFSIETNK